MTPQQAGVSAEAVGKLVAKWRSGNCGASENELVKVSHKTFLKCADELEAALATAPPEQAAANWGALPPPLDLREWLKAYRIELTDKQLDVITGFIIMNCLPVQPSEPQAGVIHERIVTQEQLDKGIAEIADQPQPVSAGALSTLVEKWRAHRSGFVYTDATYRNCAEELEAALAVGLSAKQMPYSGSLREAIGTCAYQLEQFVRAAILTPGQKERLLEIRTRLLQDLAAAIPALAAHDQKVRELREAVDSCDLPRAWRAKSPCNGPEEICCHRRCADELTEWIRRILRAEEEHK